MPEIKDSDRALVHITYDGSVHKTFRGSMAAERFANEVKILRHLESKGCDFVPRIPIRLLWSPRVAVRASNVSVQVASRSFSLNSKPTACVTTIPFYAMSPTGFLMDVSV